MSMDRHEFNQYIHREVYGGQNLSWGHRYRLRHINPATNAVYLLRLYQYHAVRDGGWHRYKARRASLKLVRRYNIYLGPGTKIGLGLAFPHPTGIVIGQTVVIGENCTIFQGVTIGSRRSGDYKLGRQPNIGKGVTLYAGCKVIGDITLGDGVKVGANAVLGCDAPAETVWVGIPASSK